MALPPNPVWRSYAGGSVLRRFRGLNGTIDDHFPEDWLASTVRARNGSTSQDADEGLSRVGPSADGQPLARLLTEKPEFWFGSREAGSRGVKVLWKLLDASVCLQFQAHPDAWFARRYLNSHPGKTECWYILGTRGDACVYLGFPQAPWRVQQTNAFTEEELIGPAWHSFFRLHWLRGPGAGSWAGDELMLLIALKGDGKLSAGAEVRELSAVQNWLLPGAAMQWDWTPAERPWELLCAKLPVTAGA